MTTFNTAFMSREMFDYIFGCRTNERQTTLDDFRKLKLSKTIFSIPVAKVAGPTGKFLVGDKIVEYVDFETSELDKVMINQKQFQQLLENDVTTKEFTKEMFLGLHCEASEALQELSWKNWKKHGDDNMDKFLEEMADIFLFYTNILLSKSISFNSLLAAVYKKQQKNVKRQEAGY